MPYLFCTWQTGDGGRLNQFVLIDREVEKSSNKTSEFKKVHDNHLARNWEIMAENKEIIDKKFEKYAAYKKPVVPPPLKEK